MIWANDKIELKENLNGWHNISKQKGLKINKNKTVDLKISCDQTATNVNLQEISLKEVDTFLILAALSPQMEKFKMK